MEIGNFKYGIFCSLNQNNLRFWGAIFSNNGKLNETAKRFVPQIF